ncbi:MAG: helix-turn-helix domain-containing protein [Desulfocucumaceae bacterium]
MAKITKELGLKIRSLRKERHLTQEELAEKADVHPGYIGRLERAEVSTTVEMLSSVATGLGIEMADLFVERVNRPAKRDIIFAINQILNKQSQTKLKLLKNVVEAICKENR